MSTDASGTVSTLDKELPPADSIVPAADGEVTCPTSTYLQQNDSTSTNISTETSQAYQDESVAVNKSSPPLIPLIAFEVQAPGNESPPSKELGNAAGSGTLACTMNELGLTHRQEREAEREEPEYFCGIGPCHPPWLQWLRDARVFTVLLCLYSIVEGALVTGLTASVISTIERRYHLTSTATGALASINDVSVIVSVIFITYIGAQGHKPRWLGMALVIEAIGAFVFSLPQFIFGHYKPGGQQFHGVEICNDEYDFIKDCGSSNNGALVFFFILIGLGAAPLFTIGTSYLDEIVNPKYTSIHLGSFYITAIIGPALGFLSSGAFLSIYVDPFIDTDLEPTDPGWVGAWWLCYIFFGILSLIIAIPFFLYPRLLPDSEKIRLLREQEMALSGKAKKEPSSRLQLVKNFPLEVKKVVTNLSWLFVTVGLACASIGYSGLQAFGVKLTEIQFGVPISVASILGAVRTVPSALAGAIASTLIIYIFKLKGRQLVLMCLIMGVLASGIIFAFLLYCPTMQLAGVTVPYPDGTIGLPDTSSLNQLQNCTASCNCTSSVFEPVCGANNVVYFSPCHAGCPFINNETGYEQCFCITEQHPTANTSEMYSNILEYDSTASEGLCNIDCGWKLQLYHVITSFTLFCVFMTYLPNIIITIRCVADEQRTFALGLQSSIVRLVGFVPGPIVFGTVVDSTCLFWQNECGQRGNCWVYDRPTLSSRITALCTGTILWYVVFIILSWFVYPREKANIKNIRNSLDDQSTSYTNMDVECSELHGNKASGNSASNVMNGAVEMQMH